MKSLIPVGFLAIALAVLAGLQYRWIGEISQAERQRLENGLRDSSERFARDFGEEFGRIPRTFEQRGPFAEEPAMLVERYRDWKSTASHPGLIRNIYTVIAGPDGKPQFNRLDLDRGTVAVAGAPTDLSFPKYLVTPRGIVFELDPGVLTGEVLPALAAIHFPKGVDRNYRLAVVKADPVPETIYSSSSAWTSEDLAHPDYSVNLFGGPRGPGRGGEPRGQAPEGFDPSRNDPFRGEPFRGRDPRQGEFRGFRGDEPRGPRGPGGPGPGRPGGSGGPGGPITPTLFRELGGAGNLRLVVKHEAGSVELAVAQLRWRNLAVSFGILVVLAGAALTVLASGQRAHALGRMQVEFAAGVSHELRTPLAVIQSAAHNLRAGVVREPRAIEQYAGIVQSEARRLSDMVEQVMTYAETQSGKKRYDVSAFDVRDVIDPVLKGVHVADEVTVDVEQRVEDGLPPAFADPLSISQCLQNLISNALKYGRRDNHVRIEIEASGDRTSGEIRLSVMDRGNGVAPNDVRRLFEAFHRGSNATAGTPGNGLGLHLVRKTMEAQNGSIEFAHRPGGGACFTLVIPGVKSHP